MLFPSLFSVVDGKTTIIYQYILADVIAMVVDVIATWLQVVIAVVIAMVADVIAKTKTLPQRQRSTPQEKWGHI